MTAKPLMIQGTMSNVGKSLLVAGLARVLVQDGYSVAPFKSQNMALNSFVTADGREMGRAQAMQAQAAGLDPVSDMNPILLKPEGPRGSQVIVDGLSRGTMSARDYFAYRRGLAPQVEAAYRRLARTHDIVLIEGAGSPAEINLQRDDIVNMGMARMVDSPVLLVGDIDPGGVFAQLAGTVALVPQEDRRRIRGLIINKFRGDVSILRPGLAPLEELCGAPVLGVVPYARLDIDDEDSLSPRLLARSASRPIDVAVVRLPHLSNFTDFDPPAMGPWEFATWSAPAIWAAPIWWCCPEPKARWPTLPGCGEAVSRTACCSLPEPLRPFWVYAADSRCWARSCAILTASRGLPPPRGVWGWSAPCSSPPRRWSARIR